jgi:hypothetical protein
MEMVNQGWHRGALMDLYRPFRDHLPEVFEHAATFESSIVAMYPALVPQFKRMREKHGDSVGFLPFKGRHGNTVLVLNRAGDVIDSVALPN